ncbi:hypothetical protein DFJ58DRAFT_880557 [Suillus subalutaceus]|uniref:uncharacterized protein n=1 Tax=Suillus subalutaceus TaxID=48586 RepID=UPI001B85D7C3|nr:uncharacterized protein DFJ58DRAFT_880557 [Suillus subalutaceus]KAG1855655.1 hypothetical protein DFJ58DRAFT_880557 [Suillus subalutaceus]
MQHPSVALAIAPFIPLIRPVLGSQQPTSSSYPLRTFASLTSHPSIGSLSSLYSFWSSLPGLSIHPIASLIWELFARAIHPSHRLPDPPSRSLAIRVLHRPINLSPLFTISFISRPIPSPNPVNPRLILKLSFASVHPSTPHHLPCSHYPVLPIPPGPVLKRFT